MKLLMLVAFTCVLAGAAESKKMTNYLLNKPQCTDKRKLQLEMDMAKLSPIGSKSNKRFPETYADVMVYCREITKVVAKTETFFKECYEKSIRDYANILIYTTKKNLKKYCGKKGSRVVRELLKLAPCANKNIKANSDVIMYYRKYMNQTSQLTNINNDKIKVPHACCYYVDAVKSAEEFLNNIPCLRPHVSTLMDYFRTGTSSITEIMCGEYDSQSDKCAKLGKAPVPTEPNTKTYITPISLMVDLMESMKDHVPSPNIGSF